MNNVQRIPKLGDFSDDLGYLHPHRRGFPGEEAIKETIARLRAIDFSDEDYAYNEMSPEYIREQMILRELVAYYVGMAQAGLGWG